MTENIVLIVAGLIGGLIAGLTGIGTGFIMLVVMPLFLPQFGVPESFLVKTTIANAIFSTFISSIANIVTTVRHKSFYLHETLWVAAGAVACSLLVFETVVKSRFYSRDMFNAIVVVFMFTVIIQTFKKLRLSNPADEQFTTIKLLATG